MTGAGCLILSILKVAFVATGSSKADVLPHVLGFEERNPPLPSAAVKPTNGVLHWFVDQDAAVKLSDAAKM